MHIPVPPLRERSEDVRALLDAFFERFATQYQRRRPVLTDEAWMFLRSFHWPGNVRQLKNVAERLVLRDFPRPISVADLPREITEDALVADAPSAAAVDSGRPDRFDSLMRGESFWTAVHEPFMSRDLTRDDLRQLVRRGLTHTHGSYRQLTTLFNLPPTDYKSLLNFLRKHDCHVPVQALQNHLGRRRAARAPSPTHSTMWTATGKPSELPHAITKSA